MCFPCTCWSKDGKCKADNRSLSCRDFSPHTIFVVVSNKAKMLSIVASSYSKGVKMKNQTKGSLMRGKVLLLFVSCVLLLLFITQTKPAHGIGTSSTTLITAVHKALVSSTLACGCSCVHIPPGRCKKSPCIPPGRDKNDLGFPNGWKKGKASWKNFVVSRLRSIW